MKIALLGCGHIAHVHMRFLQKIGRSAGAICEASVQRAADFAGQYDIDTVYHDLAEMLRDYQPDVVHILVPPQHHFNLARQCLESGCHVFVEKPLCESFEQYEVLHGLAGAGQLVIGVDHTRVYNPMLVKAREQLASGRYGEISHLNYDYDDPSIVYHSDKHSRSSYIKGSPEWFKSLRGGVATDLLPHPISVFASLLPDLEIKSIQGSACNGSIEEALVTFADDSAAATARISTRTQPLRNKLEIYCTRGSIRIDLRNLYAVYLPHRNLPNIVNRVLNTFSETLQIQWQFIKNMVLLVFGKVHMYDGLDAILSLFYQQVEQQNCDDLPLINSAKVTRQLEQIVTTLVPDDQTLQAINQQLKQELSSRLQMPATSLVTGGTGFIGSELVQELIGQRDAPRVFCRSLASAAEVPQQAALHIGNLQDSASITTALEGIETVYHCAAAMSGDWATFQSSTVAATQNLLSAIEKSDVRRLVYVSSLGILNYSTLKDGDPVTTDSPLEAEPDKRGFYTKAKLEAEQVVVEFSQQHADIEVVIVRPGLVYGSTSNNNLANAGVLLGKILIVFGMGQRQLGLNYVKNLSRALAHFGRAPYDRSRSIVQCVDSEQPTVKNYIKLHNSLASSKVAAIYIPVFIWRSAFFVVDRLLGIIRGENPYFSYRFNSNSKSLRYKNDIFGENLLLADHTPTAQAIKETLFPEANPEPCSRKQRNK